MEQSGTIWNIPVYSSDALAAPPLLQPPSTSCDDDEDEEDEEEEADDSDDFGAFDAKKFPMPFCQPGVGLTTVGFPPPYLPFPAGEPPSAALELDPPPPRVLRGALAATTFLEEDPAESALVRTMIN